MDNNPYAVERTTHYLGRAGDRAELPADLVLTLVRLPDTEFFEVFANGEQVGAMHRNDDFVGKAAQFLGNLDSNA